MSAVSCPVAARSRPSVAAQPQKPQRQARALTPSALPFNRRRSRFVAHRRISSSTVVASTSSSAPKLTNKPAWAGESARQSNREIGRVDGRERNTIFPSTFGNQ